MDWRNEHQALMTIFVIAVQGNDNRNMNTNNGNIVVMPSPLALMTYLSNRLMLNPRVDHGQIATRIYNWTSIHCFFLASWKVYLRPHLLTTTRDTKVHYMWNILLQYSTEGDHTCIYTEKEKDGEKGKRKKTMISSTTLSLSNLPPTSTAPPPPTPPPPTPPPPPLPATASSNSELKFKPSSPASDPASPTEPQPRKIKTSPQLNRWSRARVIRSGRKLDRPVQKTDPEVKTNSNSAVGMNYRRNSNEDELALSVSSFFTETGGGNGIDETDVTTEGKPIFMVSDGTGWTAEHSVNAALGQFEHCLVDRVCPVNTHLFSGIDDVERLMEIVKQAAKEGAMVVYTLADPSMAESARQACKLWGVPSTDILGPITEAIASHLGVSPSGLPRWAPGRTTSLNEEYFRRIEAIEFTIKQDDGALPGNLHKSDIILAGVSRTGKTPLSIYLAQKGYKVANVPIVMNVELPNTLFEVDPLKVFGLTINPVVLQTIRRARAKTLGFGDEARSNYSEMDYVKEELEFSCQVFAQNPVWPVIEVTGKAIEETAAIVLGLYHDRKNKCAMLRISKRY